jgi:hypothetical protein
VLALLRLRAPGWPSGPGDSEDGLVHARAAVSIAPDYPPNQLCLGEALAANGERAAAVEAFERAERLARREVDSGSREAVEWLEEARRVLAEGQSRP